MIPNVFNWRIFTARNSSLREGNVFTSVCQEFCPRGWGAWHALPTPRPHTPLPHLGMHAPRHAIPPSGYYEMRSMSGRYASYWKTFLLNLDINPPYLKCTDISSYFFEQSVLLLVRQVRDFSFTIKNANTEAKCISSVCQYLPDILTRGLIPMA